MDNIRNSELIGILLYNENNVLCVGPTGTGKTLTIIKKLSRNMHKKFICDYINFSARTTANQTQVSEGFNKFLSGTKSGALFTNGNYERRIQKVEFCLWKVIINDEEF